MFQGVEGLWIAEELGHVHQDVPVERFDLGGVLLQRTQVVLDGGDVLQEHTARYASDQCGLPVVRKVETGRVAHQRKDLREGLLLGSQRRSRRRSLSQVRM